jgi:hypothetical protein
MGPEMGYFLQISHASVRALALVASCASIFACVAETLLNMRMTSRQVIIHSIAFGLVLRC